MRYGQYPISKAREVSTYSVESSLTSHPISNFPPLCRIRQLGLAMPAASRIQPGSSDSAICHCTAPVESSPPPSSTFPDASRSMALSPTPSKPSLCTEQAQKPCLTKSKNSQVISHDLAMLTPTEGWRKKHTGSPCSAAFRAINTLKLPFARGE